MTEDPEPMRIKRMKVADIHPADYNPRVELRPGMPKYETLKRSLDQWGLVEPLIWNERTKTLVGGHQRLTILKSKGIKETEVVVVDLTEEDERELNIMLNNPNAQGEFDWLKLREDIVWIRDHGGDLALTGFTDIELSDIFAAGAELPRADIEQVIERVERRKIPWGLFKVFHVMMGNQLHSIRGLNQLISFGNTDERPEDLCTKPKGCSIWEESMLFVDSGLLTGSKEQGRPFLEKQGEVIDFARALDADWVAMMDIPQIPQVLEPLKMTPQEARSIHYRHAQEFSEMSTGDMRKVFVMQGRDLEEYDQCCRDLKPYIRESDVVALGGVKDKSADVETILRYCKLVKSHYPMNDLHLFGIGAPMTVAKCAFYGATSCDVASAGLAQFRGGLLLLDVGKDGGYVTRFTTIAELSGIEYLSTGGKLWHALRAFSASQIEAAIALSMVNEEASILLSIEKELTGDGEGMDERAGH